MEDDQSENEISRRSNNSVSPDDADEDDSEDFNKREDNSEIHTTRSSLATREKRKWNSLPVLFSIIAIVFALFGYLHGTSSVLEGNVSELLNNNIMSTIEAWRMNYPNQRIETWGTISGQLREFVEVGHMSPLIFVMGYNEADKTARILASEISRAALNMKNGKDECGDMDVVKLSGSDKEIKPGYLLSNYIKKIEKCRKMLMFNLEELDGSAAKDLHSLLDSDYPNVHNVVYIFTVKIPDSERNVYIEVQNTLRNHWSAKIEDDKLNPLLSRLVNNVKIIPEPIFDY